MSRDWFRMYHEFASDPKVQSMSEAMQRRLVMVLCLRCQCADEDARAGGTEGTGGRNCLGLADDEIAAALRISADDLSETHSLFMRKGFVDEAWRVLAWDRRQYVSDSSTHRVRKFRDGKRSGNATDAARDDKGNGHGTEARRDGNGKETGSAKAGNASETFHSSFGSGDVAPPDTEAELRIREIHTHTQGTTENEGRARAQAVPGGGEGECLRHVNGEDEEAGRVESATAVGDDFPGMDVGIEFQELRAAYDAAARAEAPLAGFSEYKQLRASRTWPGFGRIDQALDLWRETQRWKNGFAPGLARFLRERWWLLKPTEADMRGTSTAGAGVAAAPIPQGGSIRPGAAEIDARIAAARAEAR